MVVSNFGKANALACTKEVCRYLTELGAAVMMSEEAKKSCDCDYVEYGEFYSLMEEAEAVIAVGGDGTILHAAKHAVAYDRPVFGINAGRLGFLAGLEPDELNSLQRLVQGDYRTKTRMMLEVVHQRGAECSLISGAERRGASQKARCPGSLIWTFFVWAGLSALTVRTGHSIDAYRLHGLFAERGRADH